MTKNEQNEIIRHQKPFFLEKAKRSGYICPVCGNGEGMDGDGIALNKDGVHYKCFKCGFYGDVIDLIGEKYAINDDRERFKKARELYRDVLENAPTAYENGQKWTDTPHPQEEQETDFTEFFLQAKENNDFKYLESRGIGRETQERFYIGFVLDWRSPKAPANVPTSPRCIIPTSKHSYIARDTRAELTDQQKRYAKMKAGNVSIFNEKALTGNDEVIFIVEGEIDALSVIEVGAQAVGLGSTSNIEKFIKSIENADSDKKFVIMLDNDKAGIEASEKLKGELKALQRPYIDYKDHVTPFSKDPNEELTKDRNGFKTQVMGLIEEVKKITPTSGEYKASELLSYFENIESQEPSFEVKTCFNGLDNALDGGLFEGLYIIGAVSSLGKTTFTLQLANQIADTNDIIFVSLEQSKYEIVSKSISRKTFEDNREAKGKEGHYIARTTRQILNTNAHKLYDETERKAYLKAIKEYGATAERFYIYEGRYKGERLTVKHIREIVKDHIKKTGNIPVVFIDYLQILAPLDPRASDKQNTDSAVFELKEISRDYKIPVFAISSFNRENYTQEVNLTAFKESGAIEYSADVLFGLQYKGVGSKDFDLKEASNKFYREVQLRVLKNRNGGKDTTIDFKYCSMFNHFEEVYDPQALQKSFNEFKQKKKVI